MKSLVRQIVDENFLNQWKDLDPHIQEANRTHSYLSPKRCFPRHNVLKLPKVNYTQRILISAREEKKVTSEGKPIMLSLGFLGETLQAKRELKRIFKL